MKRTLATIGLLAILVLLVCGSLVKAQEPPDVDFKFTKKPPGGTLTLPVGESHTFEVRITSSEPFSFAMAMSPSVAVPWSSAARAAWENGLRISWPVRATVCRSRWWPYH